MSVPKRKPTKAPLLPAPGSKLDDYVSQLHPSLFTNPSYFLPVGTGITGNPTYSGVVIGTARKMFVAIMVSGASAALAATVTAPLRPVATTKLTVTWMGPPTVEMDTATMDENGVIALPDWDVYGKDILISGIILEA